MVKNISSLIILTVLLACNQAGSAQQDVVIEKEIVTAAERTDSYFNLLEGKRIALVGNHSSLISEVHIVDSLLAAGINLVKVFSPEHGFRGKADAGEKVNDGVDQKTGLPLVSLYGNNKKPSDDQLEGIDIIVFDIQDVGARFYTYISTLHYVMEAAAENGIPVIVLDRPNPNGNFIDGPVLEKEHQSFVGMHPIPVVHGMTIGEYARMINGEGWLKNQISCDLTVIKCENYSHSMSYQVLVSPSPNLPNMKAIYLYPSLCFFEGTPISVGRGTPRPFQQIGHPDLKGYSHVFTPQAMSGAKNPKLKGAKCYGKDFSGLNQDSLFKMNSLNLEILLKAYKDFPEKENFFSSFFTLLAGTKSLENDIKAGLTASEIREHWQPQLEKFKKIREKYLLYP